ncbi:MAG: hypothetical protein WAM74_12080, partial [Xanthobacteraceae bacterium]
GIADLVPVLPFGHGIGAGRQHLVDRVEAAAKQPVLRTVAIERDAERENLAGTNEACRFDDIFRPDLVERADVIVLAPTPPVLELLCRFGDGLFADLDIPGDIPSPGVYLPWRSEGRLRVRRQFDTIILPSG